MRFFFPGCAIFLFLISVAVTSSSAASLEPLGMLDAQLLPKNHAELRIGASYQDGTRNLFRSGGNRRRLSELPSLTLNLGLGERVEGQLQYSYLQLKKKGQSNQWGSGDLTVVLKVRLWQESPRLPAMAVRLATKLPNASFRDDFGTNQFDFFMDFLATRNYSTFSTYLNLGLAILGEPRRGFSGQDDSFRYAVGVQAPLLSNRLHGLMSVEGMAGNQSINHRCALKTGIQLFIGRWMWDLGGSVGLHSRSENWGVRTGLTLPFTLSSNW